MSKQISIGISDLNIARNDDILVTYALGSCVGICLYDTVTKIAGLSHIMLPCKNAAITEDNSIKNIMKYADTAIPELINRMIAAGASRTRITAKIAGGAQMFATSANSSIGNIGERNIAKVKEVLKAKAIRIIAEDVGLNYGRTVYFDSATGVMRVKSLTAGDKTF